jgi:uncharacterized lipoprotein YbaY
LWSLLSSSICGNERVADTLQAIDPTGTLTYEIPYEIPYEIEVIVSGAIIVLERRIAADTWLVFALTESRVE